MKLHALGQDQVYASLRSFLSERTGFVQCKENQRKFWEELAQLKCCLYTVHDGHGEVQHNKVELDLLGYLDALFAVARLLAFSETIGQEGLHKRFAYRGIVVHNQDGLAIPTLLAMMSDTLHVWAAVPQLLLLWFPVGI
jgi:hypothetical protein